MTPEQRERLMPMPEPTLRCAYCRLENDFRPMIMRTEGWLQCESCGHNAMPLVPSLNARARIASRPNPYFLKGVSATRKLERTSPSNAGRQ
jgi:hypothetical protein